MMPEHVAVIMDGNGRWAAKRRLPHWAGHRAGAQTLRKISDETERLGVKYLTVFALSTENWKRPSEEVEKLLQLMQEYIQQYINDTEKNNMRVSFIGDRSRFESGMREKLNELEIISKDKTGLHMYIALNYGGRDEIVRAAKKIAFQVLDGQIELDKIDEHYFNAQLDTAGIPYPDLLIRTGNEMRLSNFLLWQLAYTEHYITEKLWPDFSARDLRDAFDWFNGRKRRFGGRP